MKILLTGRDGQVGFELARAAGVPGEEAARIKGENDA